MKALVLVASTRAAAGVYPDRSGPVLADGLRSLGFEVDGPMVHPDGSTFADALRAAVSGGYELVITSGGTGITPADRTPEDTRAVLDRTLPGIAEVIRARGVAAGVPTAALSRGLAGVSGRTLVINVAGSPGAARDALEVLTPLLPHAIDQLRGGEH